MIRVSKRASVVRCVVCHAEDGELATCPGCEAWAHVDCRREVGRCPTLGCSDAVEPAAGALPSALDVAVARAARAHEVEVARNRDVIEEHRRLMAEIERLNVESRQRTEALERETSRAVALRLGIGLAFTAAWFLIRCFLGMA